ncbi:MAG: 16S rRNA (cytidine(1402)-2'-O)-methyltransferase [Gammaproteobacteria bacterium]|nr:16S rRNA (cytidine(1402)-2'-O)-methyltransferase [Gammaproteobacteria bacterium]NVK87396.1 16S rRNA (cytidine(1402)-2'-O)-methyltransferase [Gammaproteobacteria bacterium]
MNSQYGTLYVVATPIGNLEDMTERGKSVLRDVDCILAEDTRRTQQLLSHYGIRNRLISLHDHNERQKVEQVAEHLRLGQSMALVSDAGTPLISDPGYVLVSELRQQGFSIVTVPGASAITAALSIAGLPTDRFCFEGFLPAKDSARRKKIATLVAEPRTWVFYESSHRIKRCLDDLQALLGDDRQVVICRELTKRFETVLTGSLAQIAQQVSEDSDQSRGEFVVLVAGNPQPTAEIDITSDKLLSLLLPHTSTKVAAQIAAEITGQSKKQLYQKALELKS